MPESDTTQARVLGGDDVELARAMLDRFGRKFDDAASYSQQEPDDGYLCRLLGSENFMALIALTGDQVVGGLAGYVLPKFEQARSEFYIYDLAVDSRRRRRGVATVLIERLRRLAASRGIYVIFVQADHWENPAIALYTKLGVWEDVLHFDIEPCDGET
jgi:ribosomal protein S18 acetylase RimI-like enzyme